MFTISPIELATGYAGAAFTSLALGSCLSYEIRSFLAYGGNHAEGYYTTVTSHGLVMIFLVLMPILFGVIANGLTPQLFGLSDLLFPRLNSAGAWLLLSSFALLLLTPIVGDAPYGWTLYPPLSETVPVSGDTGIFSLHLAGASSIALAINLLVCTYLCGATNIRWRECSLPMQATSVANFLLVLTLPALAGGITLLLLDRNVNAGYYVASLDGDPSLYQQIFWFFGVTPWSPSTLSAMRP